MVAVVGLAAHPPGAGEASSHLLKQVQTAGRSTSGPLREEENAADFYAYLLATRPTALTTAALGVPVWRIGASTPTGIALVTPSRADQHLSAGDDSATGLLAEWAREWRGHGRPGLDRIRPELHRDGRGWTVRPVLDAAAR
ncbi:hypothetical protein [Nonomuraea ceibae]|uniref:hypothetical protein n=1 Tax=Nonomuraea ceibae TaxID=1935170 RepID=UPI001C5FB578|nr:hypothetical protein [Nonomuraea ceibae]